MEFDCHGCGKRVWADIVDSRSDGGGKGSVAGLSFAYVCSCCHTPLGPVKRDETPTATARASIPVQPGTTTIGVSYSPAVVDARLSGHDIVSQLRARLDAVDTELAKADDLRIERATLKRLLAAADRKPKTKP